VMELDSDSMMAGVGWDEPCTPRALRTPYSLSVQ